MPRFLLTCSLTLVVVLAHTYCVERHAREAAGWRGAGPVPLSTPAGPSCENESACICKGAVLAVSITPPDPLAPFEWLLAAPNDAVPAAPAEMLVPAPAGGIPRPAFSILCGTAARAWLQSFLI